MRKNSDQVKVNERNKKVLGKISTPYTPYTFDNYNLIGNFLSKVH